MNLQLDLAGSQSKAIVSNPTCREMPNFVFKAPTCKNRDSRCPSTRQGGSYNPVVAGLILLFLALTVTLCRVRMIIIDLTDRLFGPVNYIAVYSIFRQILPSMEDLNGVYPIESVNLYNYIQPPA